jgi:hypothetical protein
MPSDFGEYVFNVGWICKDFFIIIIYYLVLLLVLLYFESFGEGHIWCIHIEDVYLFY